MQHVPEDQYGVVHERSIPVEMLLLIIVIFINYFKNKVYLLKSWFIVVWFFVKQWLDRDEYTR